MASAPRLGRGGRRFKSAHPDKAAEIMRIHSAASLKKILLEGRSMAQQKADGVIEAVRYAPDGNLDLVRIYERRGPAFSDVILLDRETLLRRIRKGERFFTGKRKISWGSSFDIQKEVHLVSHDGKEYLTTRTGEATRDILDAPLF